MANNLVSLFVFCFVLCLFLFGTLGTVRASIIRNQINVSTLALFLDSDPPPYLPEWNGCPKNKTFDKTLDPNLLSWGLLVRMDCKIILDMSTALNSRPQLSDTDIFWLGYAFAQVDQDEMAIHTWRQSSAGIGNYLVELAWEKWPEDNKRAKDIIDLAVATDPKKLSLWLSRGNLLKEKYPKLAVSSFLKVIELQPENSQGYLSLGIFRRTEGFYTESAEWCRKATIIEPDSLQAWQCVGRSSFYDHNWEQAKQAFTMMLSLAPDDPYALFFLGRTYRYEGQPIMAYQYLDNAVELAEEQDKISIKAFALYELGYAQKEMGQPDKAVEAFVQVLEVMPEFLYAEDTKGQIIQLQSGGSP